MLLCSICLFVYLGSHAKIRTEISKFEGDFRISKFCEMDISLHIDKQKMTEMLVSANQELVHIEPKCVHIEPKRVQYAPKTGQAQQQFGTKILKKSVFSNFQYPQKSEIIQ